MKRVITIALVIALSLISPALAGGYRDYNPSIELLNQSNDYGYANIIVKGVPHSNPFVYVVAGTLNTTQLNVTQVADYKIDIFPDGTTSLIKIPSGNWTGYIVRGTGGPDELETRQFKSGNKAFEWVVFEGEIHATGSGGCN